MNIRPIFAILLLISLFLGACAPAVSDADLQATIAISIALTALSQTATAPAATTEAPAEATTEATLPPPTEAAAGPEVVFLAEGTFSAEEKTQIMSRFVEPFILYHRTAPDYPVIVSIAIEPVEPTIYTPDCLYSAQAIFEGGMTAGQLICMTGGLVDWWFPDCMGPCPFSDEFRAAYPEIVAIVEP